jgi:hypothetical protein
MPFIWLVGVFVAMAAPGIRRGDLLADEVFSRGTLYAAIWSAFIGCLAIGFVVGGVPEAAIAIPFTFASAAALGVWWHSINKAIASGRDW